VSTSRLEAFSDAVIAIVMTIMVLELHVPETLDLRGLVPILPELVIYALSFAFLGIYWNNHHHLFQAATRVNGAVLWSNMHLLFWLSLVPFATGWMGRSPMSTGPVAAYGFVLLLSALAYWILAVQLVRLHGPDSALARAMGGGGKEKVSLALYAIALVLAFVLPAVSFVIYVLIAVIWIVPDPRIERVLGGPPA
jgi:uncharacterized membrane protein